MDIEIPLGRRDRLYRTCELVPGIISGLALTLLFVLPFLSPRLAVAFVLGIAGLVFVRSVRGAIDLMRGYRRYRAALRVDYAARLVDLSLARRGLPVPGSPRQSLGYARHREAIEKVRADPSAIPDPQAIRHAVIIAAYNEPFEVVQTSLRSLVQSSLPADHLAVFFAYEERGGKAISETVRRVSEVFGRSFGHFEVVEHPADIPDEVAGKGANITFAGRRVSAWAAARGLDPALVLVTTLDCDNRVHDSYFDAVSYEFTLAENRGRASFQPVSLYTNNIWQAPAPTRVIASANSFWNLVSSVRPLVLRNFASHSQPLDALEAMDYWSRRTIVEDGHQYWRSYMHFGGDYRVVPIHVPVLQDAVVAGTLAQSLRAQFAQLSRWSYGASDVPYVAANLIRHRRELPVLDGWLRLLVLLEGHVSLAVVSLIIAIGGWVPFLMLSGAASADAAPIPAIVDDLPFIVGALQQVGTACLVVAVVVHFKLLPPRPFNCPRRRTLGMYLQWFLYPVSLLVFNSSTALYSQSRLFVGRYRETFTVTEKVRADFRADLR